MSEKKKRRRRNRRKKKKSHKELFTEARRDMDDGKLSGALSLISRAIKQCGDGEDKNVYIELRGDIYRRLGRYDEAIKDFKKLLEHDKSKHRLHKKIGMVHLDGKMHYYALRSFEKAKGIFLLKLREENLEGDEDDDQEGEEEEEEEDEGEDDDYVEEGEYGVESKKFLDDINKLIKMCNKILMTSQEFQMTAYEKVRKMSEDFVKSLEELHIFSENVLQHIEEERRRKVPNRKNDSGRTFASLEQGEGKAFEETRFFTKEKLDNLLEFLEQKIRILVVGPTNCGKSTLLNLLLKTDVLPTDVNPCTSSVITMDHCEPGQEQVSFKVRVRRETLTLEECKELKVCTFACSGRNKRLQEGISFFDCFTCSICVCEFCSVKCHDGHDVREIRELKEEDLPFCECYEHKKKDQFCSFEKEGCHEISDYQLTEGKENWVEFVSRDRELTSRMVVESADLKLPIDILRFCQFVDVPGFGEGSVDIEDLVNEALFEKENDAVIFVFNSEAVIGREWKEFFDKHWEKLQKYSRRIMFVGTRLDNVAIQLEAREKRARKQFKKLCFDNKMDDFGLYFVECKMDHIEQARDTLTMLNYRQHFAELRGKVHEFAVQGYCDMFQSAMLIYEREISGLQGFFQSIRDVCNMSEGEKKEYFRREEGLIEKLRKKLKEYRSRKKKELEFWGKKTSEEVKAFWKNEETIARTGEITRSAGFSDEIVSSWTTVNLEFYFPRTREEQRRLCQSANLYFRRNFVRPFYVTHEKEMFSTLAKEYLDLSLEEVRASESYLYTTCNLLQFGAKSTGAILDFLGLGDSDGELDFVQAFVIAALMHSPPLVAGFLMQIGMNLAKDLFGESESLVDVFSKLYLKKQTSKGELYNQTKQLLEPLERAWSELITQQSDILEMKSWFLRFIREDVRTYFNFSEKFEKFLSETEEKLNQFYERMVFSYLNERYSYFPMDLTDERFITKNETTDVTLTQYKYNVGEGEEVVIKNLPLNVRNQKPNICREAFLCARLNHVNTISLKGFSMDNDNACILMKFYSGSLMYMLRELEPKFFDLEKRINVIDEVLNGLIYLHQMRVIHRDLKPDNILCEFVIDEEHEEMEIKEVVLCDFGAAKLISASHASIVGTRGYCAPEVVRDIFNQIQMGIGKHHLVGNTSSIDIYSLGIVIYEVLSGVKAWTDNLLEEYIPVEENIKCYCGNDVGNRVMNLIKDCCKNSPKSRPSVSVVRRRWEALKDDLYQRKNHFLRFVKKLNFDVTRTNQ